MLKISLLHAPDHSILTSKLKNLPTLGGDTPLPDPPPAPSLRSLAFVTFPLGAPPPPNALTHGTPLGTNNMEGDLNAASHKIINLSDPTDDGDVINKSYLDSTTNNFFQERWF